MLGSKRTLLIGFCLYVWAAALSPISVFAQATVPPTYRYAFVTDQGIGLLDPSAPEKAPIWYTLTPGDRMLFTMFTRAVASPDGHWIALTITTRGMPTSKIQLFNVPLGIAQPPIQVGNGFPSEMEITGWDWSSPAQEMLWSPDSRYLALNMIGSKQSDIYLYSVYDSTLTDITNLDIAQHYRIAWSNDSTRIATNSFGCTSDGQCVSKMETFDIGGHLTGSAVVSDITCELGWSPDNHYIYFENSCNGLSAAEEELYLWDTAQNVAERTTDFTTGHSAEYIVLWISSHTMLISTFFVDPKAATTYYTRTVSYDTTAHTLTAFSNDLIQQWAINPVSGQIAFRQIAQADFDWWEPRNPTVHLGQINNAALTEVAFPQASQIDGGCDLAWSPDGAYLAYSMLQGCMKTYAAGFGFLNSKTGSVSQHPFTPDDQPSTVGAIRAGWVITPGQGNNALTPPPPVLPTVTAVPSTGTPGSGLHD